MSETQAILALADGRIFRGRAYGHHGRVAGEICFNTSMTGYQEILTDPSYADQIITFTYPHIGNVGVNDTDMESANVAVRGLIVRAPARIASSYRAEGDLESWLRERNIIGIAGIDTRSLVRHLRDQGAQNGVIASDGASEDDAVAMARAWEGLEGRDLVGRVSRGHASGWSQGGYDLDACRHRGSGDAWHVVTLDFGCKDNILRKLADRDCRVTVMPASTTVQRVLEARPDGVFLSNGPGDPAAVGYAVDAIRGLLETDIPMFGICMGHQLLSQALGLSTFKLKFGHRGGNHPVRQETTGKIEITSQNHGFAVCDEHVPEHVEITHRSLFDGTVEGLRVKGKPVFSVQYHPEASPGPHDADYLFDCFVEMMRKNKNTQAILTDR